MYLQRTLQGEEVGAGLLTYPALMAADILLYQVQHLAWSRAALQALFSCHAH